MKKMIITCCLSCFGSLVFAQENAGAETEIKGLEQNEVQAILSKDTTTLKKIWDKDYVVNNPENKIVLAKPNSIDRPVLHKQRTSFTREVEKVVINGEVAISMGRETVVDMEDTAKPALTVNRRYTHIWIKKDGSWRLIARHANKICG